METVFIACEMPTTAHGNNHFDAWSNFPWGLYPMQEDTARGSKGRPRAPTSYHFETSPAPLRTTIHAALAAPIPRASRLGHAPLYIATRHTRKAAPKFGTFLTLHHGPINACDGEKRRRPASCLVDPSHPTLPQRGRPFFLSHIVVNARGIDGWWTICTLWGGWSCAVAPCGGRVGATLHTRLLMAKYMYRRAVAELHCLRHHRFASCGVRTGIYRGIHASGRWAPVPGECSMCR
jgi:hypothetical protein